MRDVAIDEMAHLEDTHWWFVGKRILVESALASVPGGRALDVGCGTGGVLASLGSRWRMFGTDVSRVALAHSHRRGLDALVTGEPSEPVMGEAREYGIHFMAAGHYATETLGIRRLGELVAERFGVEHEFIDVPNPI